MNRNITSSLFVLLSCSALVVAIFPPALLPRTASPPFITDMSGGNVHIDVPAKRVIIFPLVCSTYLTIDGGGAHILAVSKGNLEQVRMNPLGLMFPSVGKNLMIEGVFDPTVSDVEEVMRLQPDAVILSWNPGLVDPLKNAGVSGVVEIAWSRQGVHDRDHQEMWKLIGSITGKSLRTQFLLGRYAKVREQVMAVLPPRAAVPLKVAALESSDLAILGSKQLWLNDELEAVGVQNIGPGTGQAFSVDPEELMRLDPDVILLLHESNDDLSLGMFYAKPEYQSLKAIRNRHVYVVPMYSFSNQFLEEPLLLDWLAEILYQDAMPRRLRNEYRHTYAEIFQYSLSDSDIDKAIYLKENSQSAGYERFVSQVVRLNSAARAH